MSAAIQLGLEEGARRKGLLVALGIWMAGFALTAVVGWRMEQPGHAMPTTQTGTSSTEAAPAEDTDTADPGAAFMPEDTVVGHRAPGGSATMMQRP
jgi:hypothetical protein